MTAFGDVRRLLPGWKQKLAAVFHRPWEQPDPRVQGQHYRLAVGLIFRNEADFLEEWLNFHLLVGVEKFFLYNNNSTDNYAKLLAPYIERGIVSLHHIPLPASVELQRRAYTACINAYRDNARWIAFLDADEFLYSPDSDSVVDVLKDYDDVPAVAINWLMFSTSGHILRPPGPVTANYTRCQPEGNKHVKLVVNPRKTVRFRSGHEAEYRDGALAVNEQGKAVDGPHSIPPSIRRLRINHYWTKSVEEFFLKKIIRGDVVRTPALRDGQGLLTAERLYSGGSDTAIQRFVPRLRAFSLDHRAAVA